MGPPGICKCFHCKPTKEQPTEQVSPGWHGRPCDCLPGQAPFTSVDLAWLLSPFFQKCLVWMINYLGILPITKCTIFNLHFKHCVQITGSADSLAVGLVLQRGGMTPEYPGGLVVSEVTVLLIPLSRSWAHGCIWQMRFFFFFNFGLERKQLVLEYKATQTSGSVLPCLRSSASSRFLHSTNTCREHRDSAYWDRTSQSHCLCCQEAWSIPR